MNSNEILRKFDEKCSQHISTFTEQLIANAGRNPSQDARLSGQITTYIHAQQLLNEALKELNGMPTPAASHRVAEQEREQTPINYDVT